MDGLLLLSHYMGAAMQRPEDQRPILRDHRHGQERYHHLVSNFFCGITPIKVFFGLINVPDIMYYLCDAQYD